MFVSAETARLARHHALWMFPVSLGERLGLHAPVPEHPTRRRVENER
jgi:hypothetical protein